VMNGQILADMKNVDRFFKQASGGSELVWLLLNAEAKQSGCVVASMDAKFNLKQIIPVVTQGQVDAAKLVDAIVKNYRLTEDKIVSIFADLIGILVYGNIVTSSEDVTTDQIRATVARRGEKIDAQFVKFPATMFAEKHAQEPSRPQLLEQFERYKGFYAGQVSEQNPYGFGYKLDGMVELEYFIIKAKDIQTLVEKPTEEDLEEYYERNSEQFPYEVKADPNDPQSETIVKTYSYAEVSSQIRQILIQNRTNRRAEMIFNDARDLTDAAFAELDMEKADSNELKQLAGDYEPAAAKLNEEYKIPIYTGKTGLLSAEELAMQKHLPGLWLVGQSQIPVGLSRVAFSIDEIGLCELGRFDVPKPRMWENIGPLRDMGSSMIAMVRVINARKAAEPADMDVSFSRTVAVLDETEQQAGEEDVYSVRKKVAEDLNLLKAMETAGRRTEEFVEMVKSDGWGQAIENCNKLYGSSEPNDLAGKVSLGYLTGQTRVSQRDIKSMLMWSSHNPAITAQTRTTEASIKLLDKFYALLPAGETEAVNVMAILEFKPAFTYYVIKDVSRTAVSKQDYQETKSQNAYMTDVISSDSVGITHYSPGNILKRMKFKWAGAQDSEQSPKTDKTDKAEDEGGA